MTDDFETALERVLVASWRIEMSRHSDRSSGASTPARQICTVRLTRGSTIVTGRGDTLSEAMMEATCQAALEVKP